MLNFIQYFASIGGFDGILNLLSVCESPASQGAVSSSEKDDSKGDSSAAIDDKKEDYSRQKVDFRMISNLVTPFKNLGQCLTPEFCVEFSKRVTDTIINRVRNMSEKDLKDVDKDSFQPLIFALKGFLPLNCNASETAQIIETTQLYI